VQGKRYYDCLSAYSAVNQGHCHPRIQAAMARQMSKVTLTSRAFYNDQLGPFQQQLTNLFHYDKVLLMNSGVEAGDSAIKLARRWGIRVKKVEKPTVLFAKGNFWGRSIAACASSDDPDRYRDFGPFEGLNFKLIGYDDPSALQK
jgi:ornithine--oxo-acid transaminase